MNARVLPILITFASPKGGVGKSTSCLALAGALAARDFPVRIIDLDQTGTLLRWNRQHGGAVPNISVESIAEQDLPQRLMQLMKTSTGYILIDLAGALTQTMLQTAAVAHLTITPSKLSEPDIIEATKLHHQLRQIMDRLGSSITHRILINEAPPSPMLATYQRHTLDQLAASPLTRFETMLHHRAAYAEQFFTGQPAHYADQTRPPVKKAVDELDALLDEVFEVLLQKSRKAAA